MHGILVIDKPTGYTSRDVVNVVSKKLHTKKVGHTGTLDPLATGVLVLCIGDYTKMVSLLTNHDKEYIATITFGVETDTLDITGDILKETDVIPTKDVLEQALQHFVGVQMQEVPIYSAKKVNGKKLYEYARKNEDVELPIEQIEIKALELLSFEGRNAVIRAVVSKGTYIRSLIRDISHYLHTYGVMSGLKRTRLGEFDITESKKLSDVTDDMNLLDFTRCLRYDTKEIEESDWSVIEHRNELNLDSKEEFVLLTYHKKRVALYVKNKDRYKPFLLFDKSI
ncbi:MAG: tRNA pseudouridine(55) synthase TruB [Bacilli bacterium]|nr:tRNA pseudouridine(55) synthase TruB [Bacilli bacterium]